MTMWWFSCIFDTVCFVAVEGANSKERPLFCFNLYLLCCYQAFFVYTDQHQTVFSNVEAIIGKPSRCETWMWVVGQILVKLKTSCLLGFFSHPFEYLMQTCCDDSVTTQVCTATKRNRVLYGSANWLWEFTPWETFDLPVIWDVTTFMWRHCKDIDILPLCHTDVLLSHPHGITLVPLYAIRMT